MKKLIVILLTLSLSIVSISAKTAPTNNQTIIKTPQEAATGLFQAWSKKNRKMAAGFARAEAIDKIFGVKRQKMNFKGCTKQEERGGGFECVYENKKLDLSMAMIVKVFRAGYRVVSVSFSSEAI